MRAALLTVLLLGGCALVAPASAGPSGTASRAPASSSSSDGSVGRGLEAPPRETPTPIVFPISESPADPWAGVNGDVPKTFEDEIEFGKRWEVRDTDVPCTAKRDHCLPPLAWFWVHEGVVHRPVWNAAIVAFTPKGPSSPRYAKRDVNQDKFVAFRTVPATRKNLVPGALVATFDAEVPPTVKEAFGDWQMGVIERVDWDLGLVFYVKGYGPRFITSARVAVLRYEPGAKVTILDGKARNALAVSPSDVLLPGN